MGLADLVRKAYLASCIAATAIGGTLFYTAHDPNKDLSYNTPNRHAGLGGGLLMVYGAAGLLAGFVVKDTKWRQHALISGPYAVRHPFIATLPVGASAVAGLYAKYHDAFQQGRDLAEGYWKLTPEAIAGSAFIISWMGAAWLTAQFSLVKPPYLRNLARFYLDGLVDGLTFGRRAATRRLEIFEALNPDLPEAHQLQAQIAALKGDWNGCLRSYHESMLGAQSREANAPLPVLVKKLYKAAPHVVLKDETANVLARQYAAIREGNGETACSLALKAVEQHPEDIDLALLEARVLSMNNHGEDARRIATAAVRTALLRNPARQDVPGGRRRHALVPSNRHADACIFFEADDAYIPLKAKYNLGSFVHDSFSDKSRAPWPILLGEIDSGLERRYCLISERIKAEPVDSLVITAELAGCCMSLIAEYQQRCTERLNVAKEYGIALDKLDLADEYCSKTAARLQLDLGLAGAYMEMMKPLTSLPVKFAHGDMHPGNILRCPPRLSIIDHEYCTLADPVIDSERFLTHIRAPSELAASARDAFCHELPYAWRRNYRERTLAGALRCQLRLAGSMATRGLGEACQYVLDARSTCAEIRGSAKLADALLRAAERLSQQ